MVGWGDGICFCFFLLDKGWRWPRSDCVNKQDMFGMIRMYTTANVVAKAHRMVNMVMMNFLIAVMGDTFESVKEQEEILAFASTATQHTVLDFTGVQEVLIILVERSGRKDRQLTTATVAILIQQKILNELVKVG